ncbi:hypothetical protein Z043_102298 [Scleropages formosus]|uniref:Apple domain-containing protein n=1 Tax=Scleropages formosus TaxID=113540 RepID=A0A0P7VVQ1_SCLFO|nr:hypothetical protein Z043_102298 [Scleropages formosus]
MVSSLCSSECEKELSKNVEFIGNDVLQIFSPDAVHCQLACTQHHLCQFFSFFQSDWIKDNRKFHCYLRKTQENKPTKINAENGVTSGYALRSCGKPGEPCWSVVYKDVVFNGSDYSTLFTDSYKNCQITCNKDLSCMFFTYHTEDYNIADQSQIKNCFLKHNREKCHSNPHDDGISGFPNRHCGLPTGCIQERFENIDFNGYDLHSLRLDDVQQCEDTCTADPFCQFYTYAYKSIANPYYRSPSLI